MLCKFCDCRCATVPYVYEGNQHFLCDLCHPCTDEPRPALSDQEIALLRDTGEQRRLNFDGERLAMCGSIWSRLGQCVRRRDVSSIARLGALLCEVADAV